MVEYDEHVPALLELVAACGVSHRPHEGSASGLPHRVGVTDDGKRGHRLLDRAVGGCSDHRLERHETEVSGGVGHGLARARKQQA